jgi:RNA polymerase sigma-70 factor (ECF subfamily)
VTAYNSYDEKKLLLLTAQGDETAFGMLFHSHHNKLGVYILKLTDSFPLAQEIVQDVFLKIWEHRSSLQQVQNFEAYLFVMARNRAFNCLKKIAREKVRNYKWAHQQEHEQDGEESPMGPIEGYDILIEDAVANLPPQQKKVYQLHNQEGMTHSAIALKLGLSTATVKKHMCLALRSIREHISAHIDSRHIALFILVHFFLRH